jgi:hypothetical protein
MAISTRTEDYREPGLGAGSSGGSWPDAGAAVEAAVNPAGGGLPLDMQPSISEGSLVIPEVIVPAEDAPVVIPDTPVQAVTEELGGVATDAAKLFELQLQLFEAEFKQSALKLAQPLGVFAAGFAIGTASLMVLFHAMGWALHDIFGLSVSLSLFIVTIVGGVTTAIALQLARNQMQMPRLSFAKSKAELMRNFSVLANIMQSPKK